MIEGGLSPPRLPPRTERRGITRNLMNNNFLIVRTAALMSCAIFSVCTFAAEDAAESETAELTKPKSTVEFGVGGVTDSSWKFGQYNGLNDSGVYGIGNFDIRGGAAYDSDDATRWRLTGKDIGLDTRNFTGEYKDQGHYKLNFDYDELQVNRNGSYLTPYLGVGGNNLNLPNWTPPAANNMRALPSTDLPDFHTVSMETTRKKIDGGFSYFLTDHWEVQASVRHEDKNGLQALGAPIVAARSIILPNPISQSTEQINASMKYNGEKGFGQFAYYGSLFHNDINGVLFQNPFAAGQPAFGRMSSAPDNQFHQFSSTGGYNFTTNTKLVANGSYARNWQTRSFLPYNTANDSGGLLPVSNLNGDVETKTANLKLTHRVNSDFNVASAYKYDERENNTPINLYNFNDVDSVIATGTTPTNFRSNTPYSKRINQGNLDANYSFAKGQWLKAGYEIQNIDRWCNGTWISCVDTGTTLENTGTIDYRGSFLDKFNGKLGYAYSHRTADNYNQDNGAWASYPATAGNMALYNLITQSGLPAWGAFSPYANAPTALFPNNNAATTGNLANNSMDINGLGRFNTSNRERQKVHSYLDYQVNNKLSLGVGGDFRYDEYPDSSFGLQSSRNWGTNFDTNYNFDEDTSIQVFYSYQDILTNTAGMSYGANSNSSTASIGGVATAATLSGGCFSSVQAMNNSAKTDPCRNWFTNMNDNIDTVGLGVKHKGFFGGKLDMNGDFVYSFARTLIGVDGGSYTQLTGQPAYYYTRAADMPTVKTQTFQFKLDAKYIINKPSAIHLSYMYQHLFSSDYIYTGMQAVGTPQGVVPTSEQSPTYSIHAIGLSYMYNF